MAEKLTPWFPGDVKPVHEGVYTRHYENGATLFSAYERGLWFAGQDSPQEAADSCPISLWQSLPWRGLAQDPSKEGV